MKQITFTMLQRIIQLLFFDDFTGAFKWVDFPFKVKSSAMKMLQADKNRTTLRYIFHVMGNIGLTSSEHKRLWIGIYSNIKIPLPPLSMQSEIVRILDNFTELTARKKQYGYYRDSLLTFREKQYVLEEICQIVDCPHTSPKWKDSGIPVIRNYNLINGVIDTRNLSYVDAEEYQSRTKRIVPQKDDILFSREAPIGNVGIIPENFICCQGQRVVLLRPNQQIVIPRFLLHLLQGNVVKDQIAKVEKMGSTVSNFNIGDLKRLYVTVPAIDVQKRLIQVLDNFHTICSDLNIGLQAEIEARKRQYEYYRNCLLTFVETGNRQTLIKFLQYVFGFAKIELNEVTNTFRGEYITKKYQRRKNPSNSW